MYRAERLRHARNDEQNEERPNHGLRRLDVEDDDDVVGGVDLEVHNSSFNQKID